MNVRPKSSRWIALLLGLVGLDFALAHVALLALGAGLVAGMVGGYLVGRSHGRRKAVLDQARELIGEHARAIGRHVASSFDGESFRRR